MAARLNFFPLGNADTLRIDLANGRKVLIDYAAMRTGGAHDKRCDLPSELRKDLRKTGRDAYDVVCITHTDSDHCKGFDEFFWLRHAKKYQGADRVKINELWVPAAAILEEGLVDDARIVRSEARYRLREGNGIRVFSRPESLRKWMKQNGIDFESRKHLIVDAGQTVPDFSKDGPEKVEFFVHSPFGWRQDDDTVVQRNENSIVLQVTFVESTSESRLFLASDVNHETLSDIVQVTKNHNNEDKLRWDIMKISHHCSYRALGQERGTDETKPVREVKWLIENKHENKAIMISTSDPIPIKGSAADESDQPPHRQAANYYRRIANRTGGEFRVTMEHPSKSRPKPFSYEVTWLGLALTVVAPMVSSTAAASTPKAGKWISIAG